MLGDFGNNIQIVQNSYGFREATPFVGDRIHAEMGRLANERGFIVFYNQRDPFTEWLGNFYPIQIEYNGLMFLNSEAAYQAQKFIDHPEIMAQFTHFSAEEAFYKARQFSQFIRPDWLGCNVQVMREVLQAKISQNPQIGEWLESTENALLIEHNPKKGRDAFWSDDHDGSGKNMLGNLWMEIRAERQNKSIETPDSNPFGWENYLDFLR